MALCLGETGGKRPSSSPSFFRKTKEGMTLLEILVVVAIIALIAAMAMANYLKALNRAKQKASMADMRNMAVALNSVMALSDEGRYPIPGTDFPGANDKEIMENLVKYLQVRLPTKSQLTPKDHWGFYYHYVSDGDSFTLLCKGKDGVISQPASPAFKDDFTRDIIIQDGNFIAAP